ncbi:hypothetical protein B9Z51_06510 [Limnohabitans sp. T6-5]|uniref:polysaccharide pyruvyl transferase family protein n=1 Tax=Limnohabitans sp. T6-5 TaxID=1100724 RepID=UPI000D3366F2|nr:polysaccharide pyruvyl transferase family protein [Limnohabitans sp. T6-5]PUE08603.1 hypothetical protein B9Z51_06510 [Limnohabitans sp. T6-5]
MFKKFLLSKLPFPWLNLIRMVRGNVIKVFVIVVPSYLLNEKYVSIKIKYSGVDECNENYKDSPSNRWALAFHEYYEKKQIDKIIPLMWADGPAPGNFGDWLSPYIFSKISKYKIRHVADFDNPKFKHILGVGSIAIKANKYSSVFGSGISSTDDRICPQAKYYFVRGPYTAAAVKKVGGIVQGNVTGDLGFLISRVYPVVKKSKIIDSVLVRHITHKYLPVKLIPGMIELDISVSGSDDIELFLQKLNSAKIVVTSAMHCYIACISYGIPCVLINFKDDSKSVYGDGVKYLDAMEGIGLNGYKPHLVENDLSLLNFPEIVDNRIVESKILDDLYGCFVESISDYFNTHNN